MCNLSLDPYVYNERIIYERNITKKKKNKIITQLERIKHKRG